MNRPHSSQLLRFTGVLVPTLTLAFSTLSDETPIDLRSRIADSLQLRPTA